MGLTSALNTSLNGLSLNETTIDVLGNNIANAGTNGFKASSVRFATQLSRTFSVGTRPTDGFGGTNPLQVGLGASVAVISRDFGQGSISNSTSPSDLAIQGNGFFVLDGPNGRAYTRNGNFSLNSASQLINDQGAFVLGYTVDDNFQLVTTELSPLSIPLGDLNIAQRTQDARLGGALYPSGDLATQGSALTSEVLTDTSTSANATGTSLLVDLENEDGDAAFTLGQTLSFTPKKGGRTIGDISLNVTAATTVDDLMAFMDETYGIVNGGTVPNDGVLGVQPGISISGGQIQIVGNSGLVNDLDLNAGDLRSGSAVIPLTFTKDQTAVGEGTSTEFVVYDSLGQPIRLRVSTTLESRTTDNTNWRYYFESADDSRSDIALASGIVSFNNEGQIAGNPIVNVTIQRDGVGAISPMQVNIDFSSVSGISSASSGSDLNLIDQDGAAPGTLQSFVISESGVINGVFDNGIIRTLGQVTLARFANPNGLIEDGSTTYKEGVSSGTAAIVTPGTFGVGTVRPGAIELSNTDIGKNLVDLIVASTNYRGNARVISSVQDLVNELLLLGR
ncbi:flagellar hook-basal body complex protein [bacterium]|nr:flagellar hook-basal body complex protein [bacterium]